MVDGAHINKTMQIKPGDIFWLVVEEGISHPHVVVEVGESWINLCALTTNMNKLNFPGNVVLEIGEGGLEKQSIVEVSKQVTVTEDELGEYVGTLDDERLDQIYDGIDFINKSFRRG